MDFDTLYAHYRQTGNITPLLAGAPKAKGWGEGTAPNRLSLLPTGEPLLQALRVAYAGGAVLAKSLYWAKWETVPR